MRRHAIAVRSALLFMLAGYSNNRILETESLRLVKMLNEGGLEEVSYASAIIQDCKHLASRLQGVFCKYVSSL